MRIPNGAIIPFYVVSFVILAYQYYRTNPDRRLLNIRFGLMIGAVVLMFTAVFLASLPLSLVFFALALFWLGAALYLLRSLPPRRH